MCIINSVGFRHQDLRALAGRLDSRWHHMHPVRRSAFKIMKNNQMRDRMTNPCIEMFSVVLAKPPANDLFGNRIHLWLSEPGFPAFDLSANDQSEVEQAS